MWLVYAQTINPRMAWQYHRLFVFIRGIATPSVGILLRMSLRIAHFSDIHLTARPLKLGRLDWFGKRATGWFNARMGRGRLFLDSSTVAAKMAGQIRSGNFDHVVFSGDATTLGLRIEFDEVRRVLQPDEGWPSALAVPG